MKENKLAYLAIKLAAPFIVLAGKNSREKNREPLLIRFCMRSTSLL